jgi:hypothetical protein
MIEALENISAHAVRRVECAFYCIAVGHALQLSAIGAPGIYIYIYIYISARFLLHRCGACSPTVCDRCP